jgi:hypothetical protein
VEAPAPFRTPTLDAQRATELAAWISDYGYLLQRLAVKLEAVPSGIVQILFKALKNAPKLRDLEISNMPFETSIESLTALNSLTSLTFRTSCVVTPKAFPSKHSMGMAGCVGSNSHKSNKAKQ